MFSIVKWLWEQCFFLCDGLFVGGVDVGSLLIHVSLLGSCEIRGVFLEVVECESWKIFNTVIFNSSG